MNAAYTAVTQAGVGAVSGGVEMSARGASVITTVCDSSSTNSRRNHSLNTVVDARIAMAARHPKCDIMNSESQFQGRATISTGGAAKCVNVPPIETLTNNSPSVAYFSASDGP